MSSHKTHPFHCIKGANHEFQIGEALLGAGAPGEERTHGCGGGKPAVCVGRMWGKVNKRLHVLLLTSATQTAMQIQ